MDAIALSVFGFQLTLLAAFAFFAVFNYLYGFAALRTSRVECAPPSGRAVAVVIVSYNEKYVLPDTIRACEALSYTNKLVVLSDDSDDPDILAALTDLARDRHCRPVQPVPAAANDGAAHQAVPYEVWESPGFVYLRRHSNLGHKGGNLRQVSRYLRSRGIELMYLLDADWHPQPDAIERALEALEADERHAFVQTKRVTREQGLTLFQRYASLSEEGCYYVDFEGRQALNHPILFSGCCTLLRLDAVDKVGGFAFGHLTEDLDVTNRLWLGGWKGLYRSDVVNWGEVPFSYEDFRRQQERWSHGTAKCLRDYLLPLLRTRHLSLFGKLSAIRQNAYFSTSLLTTLAILQGVGTVSWLALAAGTYSVEYYLYLIQGWRFPVLVAVYACIASNIVEPLVMILAKKRRPGELIHLPMGVWYAWSVLLTYVHGSLRGLAGLGGPWFRTPKFLRGEVTGLSSATLPTRMVNGAFGIVLLCVYVLEGWSFGWLDPFAVLLLPAFLLATLE